MKKCKFFIDEVEYLGHIIRPGRLEVDTVNTASLRDAKPPTTRTELRSFLGLCNVYRRFIRDFTHLAHPLNRLLKKGSPDKFELDDEQMKSFREFVKIVCSPPVLALPQRGLQYSVDTDACDYGIGCTLFQTYPDGERKPLGFWSRTLNDAERNYSASERECLPVVWALKTLRPYLMYEKFVVHSDHHALHRLFTITEPSSRLTRWRLRLAEFDFTMAYKKGADNHHADALSRLLTGSPTVEDDDEEEIPAFNPKGEYNRKSEQDHDDEISFIENDYNDFDELLPLQKPSAPQTQYDQITLDELINAQLHDKFCSDICRSLNEGGALPSKSIQTDS